MAPTDQTSNSGDGPVVRHGADDSAVPADVRHAGRQAWMSVLARSPVDRVAQRWQAFTDQEGAQEYVRLRAPETGLVMVRGRAGGDGAAFNLGEVTMTRCSVRLADGTVGHGYVAGRSHRHAELAAVVDGLMQTLAAPRLREQVIGPLADALAGQRRVEAEKTAATRVDFFTMVREQEQ